MDHEDRTPGPPGQDQHWPHECTGPWDRTSQCIWVLWVWVGEVYPPREVSPPREQTLARQLTHKQGGSDQEVIKQLHDRIAASAAPPRIHSGEFTCTPAPAPGRQGQRQVEVPPQ